jgi:hypothetical protein
LVCNKRKRLELSEGQQTVLAKAYGINLFKEYHIIKANRMKLTYFYVYYSYEEWGRGYIGKRQSSCHPNDDVMYMGSFTDKTFFPIHKIILQIFDNEEEALEAEILLHDFFEVDVNPHFANKAKQTSKAFVCHRKWSNDQKELLIERNKTFKWTEELRKKVSNSLSGRVWITDGKENKQLMSIDESVPDGWTRGFTQLTTDETRKKMSQWQKGKPKWNEEKRREMSKRTLGKTWWNDGKKQILVREDPGAGWKRGRLNAGVKRGPNSKPLTLSEQERNRRRERMVALNKSRTKKLL